jgi:uncharacterized membrane protein YphA (DoxX/SURF4 family)
MRHLDSTLLVAAMLVSSRSFRVFYELAQKAKGEGVEFDLLLWAIALALILEGGGAFSLDRAIAQAEKITSDRYPKIEDKR